MAALCACAVLIWAALFAARDTPIGRMLHHLLVVAPAVWLGRFSRGHIFIAVALVAFVALVFAIFEMEGVHLLSMASPEIVSVLATAEIATYVDLMVMGLVAASTARIRPIVAKLRGIVRRPRRARRTRTTRTRSAANDDDGPGWRKRGSFSGNGRSAGSRKPEIAEAPAFAGA